MLGIFFHLADTKEKAVAALRPLYEEHAKMFAPAGLPARRDAGAGRGDRPARRLVRGGGARRWKTTSKPAPGSPARRNNWSPILKELEERYPGMQDINLSTPMGTPEAMMLDQFQWVSEAVMPAFRR